MSAAARPRLDRIDALLRAWDERLRRMDENLVALEGEPSYQILAGKAGQRPALEGVTRAHAGPALDAVTELFENRARLGVVVERARAVRAGISALTFWGNDEKMNEILHLLRGPSIDLGRRTIALAERGLLDESHQDVRVDPERLLAHMVQRFEEARRALLAVSRAWRALGPELAQIEHEVASLRRMAAEIAPPAEVAEVEADLARLRERVARDPLGAEGRLRDAIAPRMAALTARLAGMAGAKKRALAALDEARAEMARLGEDHARALATLERARRELPGESVARLPSALDEGLVLGLEAWLRKLEDTVAGRRWSSAEVGLARFREAVRRENDAEVAAIAAAEALVGARR